MLTQIIQGDSYTWDTLYPLAFGDTLKLSIRGSVDLDITSTTSTITISAANSLALMPELAKAILSKTTALGSRAILTEWVIEIKPDPLASDGQISDLRSFNVKMLEALDAHLLGKATNDQLDHIKSRINDKELERMSLDRLMIIRNRFAMLVRAEQGRGLSAIQYSFLS